MPNSNKDQDINQNTKHNTGSGRGGPRPGAGRKKGQKIKKDFEIKKSRSIRMTDAEYPQVIKFLKNMRTEQKAKSNEETKV